MYCFTFQDAVDHLVDFQGASAGVEMVRKAIRAVQLAYNSFVREYSWPYYNTLGRIIMNAPYGSTTDNSTIQYQQSSGTYPFQVTLTGGTWPSWASSAILRTTFPQTGSSFGYAGAGNVLGVVSRVYSPTVLTLDSQVNFGSDIPAGTTYTLMQDTYELPPDWTQSSQPMYQDNFGGMWDVGDQDLEFLRRYYNLSGPPLYYAIRGNPLYPGRMVMTVFPAPSDNKNIDFAYRRAARPLAIQQVSGVGTMSVAQGANTVSCSSPVFTSSMQGSVLRLSPTASQLPAGTFGSLSSSLPAAMETNLQFYTDSQHFTIPSPSPVALTNVAYTISDPVDLEPGSMLEAFLRYAEWQLAIITNRKDLANIQSNWLSALRRARAQSNTGNQVEAIGGTAAMRRRLKDYPYDFGISNGT